MFKSLPVSFVLTVGGLAAQSATDLATANNEFAAALYSKLGTASGNLLFSPYSLHVALSMALAGAGGDTRAELEAALAVELDGLGDGHSELRGRFAPGRFTEQDGTERPTFELDVANAAWGDRETEFLAGYLGVLSRSFGSPLQRIDFGDSERARRLINAWVAEKTRDRIENIVPAGLPRPDTVLALANAIFFKGAWQHPFTAGATLDKPFYPAAGEAIEVPTMRVSERFRYVADDDVAVVELPYLGREASMLVVLPKRRDGLSALERELTADRLAEWASAALPRKVTVELPKFRFESSFRVEAALRELGVRAAFDPAKADFSRMCEDHLCIDTVLHKAFIAVDEAGTEAAAATVVLMKRTSAGGRAVEFKADHPFLFAIRHRSTGAILFLGRVANPVAG